MVSSSKDDETLRTYKRLRNVLKTMHEELIRRLPTKSILESAKKLGMATGKTLVFEDPDETSILFDYCLYDSRMGGKTVMERYAEKTPPPPQSDEMAVLRAMTDSFFSVFHVRQVHKGRGVLISDVFKKDEVFLMDIGLGDTAVLKMSLAGRILPFADFHMSTGALLPLYEDPVRGAVIPILEKWLLHHPDIGRTKLSPGLEANFSAQLIRTALRAGALDAVRYSVITE